VIRDVGPSRASCFDEVRLIAPSLPVSRTSFCWQRLPDRAGRRLRSAPDESGLAETIFTVAM